MKLLTRQKHRAMTNPLQNNSPLIALDFDGTLAAIVDDPAATRPIDGVIEALQRLGDAGLRVAIISGRPLNFLIQHFSELIKNPWMTLIGEYGIERVHAGVHAKEPFPDHMAEALNAAAEQARGAGPSGMAVEQKPHSMTLHYRTAPDIQNNVEQFAEQIAAKYDLETRPAKMSVELHPAVTVSKGTALTALITELAHGEQDRFPVVFIGDDIGDLPAFDVLASLHHQGWDTRRIVVQSVESPPELLERADALLDSPQAVVAYLNDIATTGW